MSLDDNNKKNTGGNTEDIFAIMEKYRADQSKSKTAAEQPREPKPDAPVKNPLPESYAAKPGTERDLPQTTTRTQPAKKPAAPAVQTVRMPEDRRKARTGKIRKKKPLFHIRVIQKTDLIPLRTVFTQKHCRKARKSDSRTPPEGRAESSRRGTHKQHRT